MTSTKQVLMASQVRVGDIVHFATGDERIRRVQMNKGEWNHVRLYHAAGSSLLRRETLLNVTRKA